MKEKLSRRQYIEYMENINPAIVMSMRTMTEKAENIAIVTHMHPDGDAIGSSMGLFHYIRYTGKTPTVILNDRYPDSLSFLAGEGKERISVYEDSPEKALDAIRRSDLIFCLDMNSFGRAENLEKALRENRCPKILIDHHLNPDAGEFDLVFSVTEISSTAELLYHILMSCPEICGDASRLPVKVAEALLAGMTTDTNNFSNSVFPSTFRMASELLGAGIDRDAIVASLYNNYRENRFRLMGELLHEVMKITPEGAAYMIISKELAKKYDLREGETEGFVNMALGIKDVRMSLLLKEEDDRFRVSVRSKRGISANRCAALYFNGGGHELAAGGKLLKEKDLDGGGPEKAASYTERVTGKFLNDIQ